MKKFFKKPFNIVSFALAVLGLIGMIVILCVPHGGTYKAVEEMDDTRVVSYIKFEGNEVYARTKVGDKFDGDYEKVGEVEIKGGKAYLLGVELFEVNAFRIKSDVIDETMTCAASVAFFIIAGVMFLAGTAGTVYALAFKKKK